jgi:adenosylcobinamide-phosphate synthase
MGREVALLASPWHLALGVALDLLFGDPEYRAHPVRLMGATLTGAEKALRRAGFDGYGGGILLFLILAAVWGGGVSLLAAAAPWIAFLVVYSLVALRDLLRHGWSVERAADLAGAHAAIANLVGRDTSKMDRAACSRAAIESMSENLTDGFISPIFWYAIGGIPGIVIFKVVSTMDSMVGYKNERYLRFGWCGARLDDLMNWIPARITWLLIAMVAMVLPGYSARKSLAAGWRQHAIVPGPNSGWSEAAAAGAIERRLIGPIWLDGKLVTETWLGDPTDPPAGMPGDFKRTAVLVGATGILAAAIAIAILFRAY